MNVYCLAVETQDSPAEFYFGYHQIAFLEKERAQEMLAFFKESACFGLEGDLIASDVGINYRMIEVEIDDVDDSDELSRLDDRYDIHANGAEAVRDLISSTMGV